MIIFMDVEYFNKKKKKLVLPKDYLILDGTEDSYGHQTSKYSNVVSVDGFNPPTALERWKRGKEDMEKWRAKELEFKYFASNGYRAAQMGAVVAMVSSGEEINVFVLLTKHAYAAFGKKMSKTLNKRMGLDVDIACTQDDLDKTMLKTSFSKKVFKEITDRLEELEEEESNRIRKKGSPEEKKGKKHKKKKDKDSDDKKGKKKKDKKKDDDSVKKNEEVVADGTEITIPDPTKDLGMELWDL